MIAERLERVSLEEISIAKQNVRNHNMDAGIDDLATSIKATGLIQPVTVFFDSEKEKYILLAGQRRFNAYQLLNEKYPDEFKDIKCIIRPEPKTNSEKLALSLAENITQMPMVRSDLVKAVTDLYNEYQDYEIVREKFGISRYMINKYVGLARLPPRLKQAIDENEISSKIKTSENAVLRAVDALKWTKGGDTAEESVLELAKAYAKNDIPSHILDEEANISKDVPHIIKRTLNRKKEKLMVALSKEVAAKLEKIAVKQDTTAGVKATSYVVDGVTKEYTEYEE